MTTPNRKLTELRGNMTFRELAKVIGVTAGELCHYEKGIRVPRDSTKRKLAEFFGVSVQYLFYE